MESIPATRQDFESYRELGRRLFNPNDSEMRSMWEGLSVFNTEKQARNSAKASMFRGYAGVACMTIPLDGSIRFERTGRTSRAHHTVWAPADRLSACVTGYVSLLWRTP